MTNIHELAGRSVSRRQKVLVEKVKQVASGSFKTTRTWKLKSLRRIDGGESSSDTEFTTFFERDHMRTFIASSLTAKNSFLWDLHVICRRYLEKMPEFSRINVVELSLMAEEKVESGSTTEVLLSGNVKDLVSVEEEKDLELLMDRYDHIDLSDSKAFEETLERELVAYEKANIHYILNSEQEISELARMLKSVEDTMGHMEEVIAAKLVKLQLVRVDIEQIEMLNNRMETHAKSQQLLVGELEKLLGNFKLPEEYEEALRYPEFSTEEGVNILVKATDALDNAINTETPDGTHSMAAIKEKMSEFHTIRFGMVKELTEYMKRAFSRLADNLFLERNRFSKRGDLFLRVHDSVFNELSRFNKLMLSAKSFDFSGHLALRNLYCSCMAPVYRKEIHSFFSVLRHNRIIRDAHSRRNRMELGEGISDAMSTISDGIGSTVTEVKRVGSVGSIAATISGQQCAASQSADMNIAEALKLSLDRVFEVTNAEQKFVVELFHIEEREETSQEVLGIIEKLLGTVKDELRRTVEWAEKRTNQYLLLPVIADVQRRMKSDGSNILLSLWLTDLQIAVKHTFGKFWNTYKKSIKDHKGNARRAGILSFVAEFPRTVEYLNAILKPDEREVVSGPLFEICVEIFEKLKSMAEADKKYADVLLLENYHYLARMMAEFSIPVLEKHVRDAKEGFVNHLKSYVSGLFKIQFSALSSFFDGVERMLQTLPAEEIQFQMSFSKVALRSLFKQNTVSMMKKGYIETLKRIDKHLCDSEGLLSTVWAYAKVHFVNEHKRYERMVRDCYPSVSLSPPADEVEHVLMEIETNPSVVGSLKKPLSHNEAAVSEYAQELLGGTRE